MMPEHPSLGLLDTSVVIDFDRLSSQKLPIRSAISTVTLAELGIGLHTTADPIERARRIERLQRAEATFTSIPFDIAAAQRY
ncbi:MAG: VapC toxin family PIN domain ribonuclease, partial [Mycobacteriales bacterium]